MSILTKIGLGVMLALFAALCLETAMIRKLDQKFAEQVASNKVMNQALKDTTDSLKQQNLLSKKTDKIITETAQKIQDNTDKGKTIKDGVDQIARRVAYEKLTVSDADNAYVDSMWSAYCTSNETASGCSARLANTKL